MKTDMSLLEKDRVPTIEELKAFFREHDFSTQVSSYDPSVATKEQNQIYVKAKKHFRSSWNEQMKLLTGKGSLLGFSSDAPVRHLEKSNEQLIAGTVMEILADETLSEIIIDSVLESFEDEIAFEIANYAEEQNKSVDEITEEEYELVFDRFADIFLATMMNLLLQVESVPGIMDVSKKNATHEDFSNSASNFDKIDFERKWDHTRTKIGNMESLERYKNLEHESPDSVSEILSDEEQQANIESIEIIKSFYDYLGDDTDIKIFKLNANGYTQKEIAEQLGFKTHSAVGKRLKKIEEKRIEFLKLIKAE